MVRWTGPVGVVGRRVFPFYVVCDVSRSMWDPDFLETPGVRRGSRHLDVLTPFQQIEQSLPGLIETLEDDISVRDTAHVSVIAFGDEPQTVLPLTPLNSEQSSALVISPMTRQYSTDYVAIFKHLQQQIREDVRRLIATGCELYTPAIYFITDGNPQVRGRMQTTSDWIHLREGFEDPNFPVSPTIVALGLGDVAPGTVRQIASGRPRGIACMANGQAPDSLLAEIIESIMHSIGNSSGSGHLEFRVPAGMTKLT
ncbi:hypothetical protein ABIB25_002287 [Nakamurella sp. UYEF19]|uniref:vWA domain-containing protein n=1 Tax=Nakamurella sp. UYEF19 TaxID=1756392 RepID=UPI0033943951